MSLLSSVASVCKAPKAMVHAAWLLARYTLLLILQAGVAAGRGHGLPQIVAAFFPLVPVLGIYDSLRFIPELYPGDRDDLLISIDRAVLGGDPSLWLERISTPWLTDLLQVAYLVYYVLPIVLLGTLYYRQTREHEGPFDLCVVALLLSHYVAFTGYMAIPALGPRFALAPTYRTELTGLLVTEPIRQFLDALEGIKRDAFPSGHVSAALISVYYMFRFAPRLAWRPPRGLSHDPRDTVPPIPLCRRHPGGRDARGPLRPSAAATPSSRAPHIPGIAVATSPSRAHSVPLPWRLPMRYRPRTSS
jgi:membrane-associated phospholipid phosphatase